jgi:tRNA(fMet)-specific endonuclease VapC
MRFLLDTNALSEPVRKRPSRAFMERIARLSGQTCTSVLCIGEMIFGARRSRSNTQYEEYVRDVVLPHTPVLDVDIEVASTYGELRALAERKGRPKPDLDLLIAATALCHELTIVTRNVRDFEGIDDLEVVDWTRPS